MARNNYYTTGLDFSDRSIEIVQFEFKGGRLRNVISDRTELPQGVVSSGEILNSSEFDRALNDLLDNAERKGITFDNLVVSLPEELLSVIDVSLTEEELKEGEIDNKIFEKIKSQLIEKSQDWKYEIFEVDSAEKKKYVFLGIENDKLYSFVKRAAEFGLNIERVEPDSITLLRHIDSSSGEVVIDFGEKKTIFYFVYNGVLHKRKIIAFGAEQIIDEIAQLSALSRDKEEKIFRRIGYSSRATNAQKKILEKKFKSLFKELDEFLAEVEADYGLVKTQVYITGGLSNMKGLKKLLPEGKEFIKLRPAYDMGEYSDYFLNAMGAALSFTKNNEVNINFLTEELKHNIKEEVENLVVEKESVAFAQELDLEDFDSEKKVEKKSRWGLSLRFTSIAQLLVVVNLGLGLISMVLSRTNDDNLAILKTSVESEEQEEVRDFFVTNFPINVYSGIVDVNSDTASVLGRFQEYIVDVKESFDVTSEDGIVTDEQIADAKLALERKIKSGLKSEEFVELEDDEILLPDTVSYEEAFSGADKTAGIAAESFEYSIRAKVKVAIIHQEKINTILQQRKHLSLRLVEQEFSDEYNVDGVKYDFIDFDNEKQSAEFNLSMEVEK